MVIQFKSRDWTTGQWFWANERERERPRQMLVCETGPRETLGGCVGFILAYPIWCELATRQSQEIRDKFPCTRVPLGPLICGRAACCRSSSSSLWNSTGLGQPAAMKKLTLLPPSFSFNSYFTCESFLNCNSFLY